MAAGSFARWMYRGGRPNRLARIMNRISALVFARGVARDYLVTLEVTGRRSGRRISLPLVMAVMDGQRYLVSMLGEKAAWVQNVRAENGKAILEHGRREEVRLEEIPIEQRAPVLIADPDRRHAGDADGHRHARGDRGPVTELAVRVLPPA